MGHKRVVIATVIAALSALVFGILNVFCGSVHIPVTEVVAVFTGGDVGETARFIVLDSRLPQAITSVLCGASLAAAGLMLQTVFANPLADPSVLGINAGASLGVAVAVLLLGGGVVAGGLSLTGFALTVVSAFVGAALVLLLLTVFAATLRSGLVLLIAGIMVGYIISAVIELLSSIATAEGVHSYIFWGMGNFGGVSRNILPVFCLVMLAALFFALLMSKSLNALLLGDNYAMNLGVSVRRARLLVFVITGILSAVPTALCGPVAFIGLAVPHMARFASATSNHRVLLPLCMLMGAAVAGACNLVCNLPGNGMLIPLNVVTSMWGVPVILYVLFSAARRRNLS